MSATKRRQVDKNTATNGKQQMIPFQQTKLTATQAQGEMTMADRIAFQKKLEQQSQIYDYNNGAKDAKSPYRSNKRVANLVKNSPHFSQCGYAKNLETPASSQFLINLQKSSSFYSKPSSVTTACTYAPNEQSVSKNEFSSIMSQRSKKEPSSDKKKSSNKKLVGQKRRAEYPIEQMEYFLKLNSSAAKYVLKSLKLRNKKTGQVIQFSMVDEKNIEALRNPLITEFDTTKLEVEYDYDTDHEQMTQSKKMLFEELQQAIEFFIKEDPLKLVDNIFL